MVPLLSDPESSLAPPVELVVPLVWDAPVLVLAEPVSLLPDAVCAVPSLLDEALLVEPTAVVPPVASPLAVPTSSPQPADPATKQSINPKRDIVLP